MKANNLKIYSFDTIDSTNDFAKRIAKTEKSDSLIIANTQTAGRGRMGRTFFSPMGGIYMSLLIHPKKDFLNTEHITVIASVAVAKAIESVLKIDTKIKWVNDIFYKDKKVCGILTEGAYNSEKKRFDYAVIGIGINLFKPESGFPKEIENIAGFLTESGKEDLKQSIIDLVLDNFYGIYEANADILDEYKSRSNVLGKEIEYIKNGKTFRARAIDISENLQLTVEANGKCESLSSGEIKILAESLNKNHIEKR